MKGIYETAPGMAIKDWEDHCSCGYFEMVNINTVYWVCSCGQRHYPNGGSPRGA